MKDEHPLWEEFAQWYQERYQYPGFTLPDKNSWGFSAYCAGFNNGHHSGLRGTQSPLVVEINDFHKKFVHIVGAIKPDKKWNQMKAVADACVSAGVSLPEEVSEYFKFSDPRKSLEVVLSSGVYPFHAKQDTGEHAGYSVALDMLPKNVERLIIWWAE